MTKPTPAQLKALRLAAVSSVRYYYGGFYTIPTEAGTDDQHRIPPAGIRYVNVPEIRACTDRGWLLKEGGLRLDGSPNIYGARWTITDAGRAALAAAEEKSNG